jgi:hypothetical protein
MKTPIERIMANMVINQENGCWVWQRCTSHNGYPQMHYNGRTHYTHVLSFKLSGGTVPIGWEVDHKCRNIRCVNPTHLEAITKIENLQRQCSANKPSACPQGHSYSDPRNVRKLKWLHCAECHRIAERSRRKKMEAS